jgi:hypothetical protein
LSEQETTSRSDLKFLGLLLGSPLAGSLVSLVSSGLSASHENSGFLHFFGDGCDLLSGLKSGLGDEVVVLVLGLGGGRGQDLGGGIVNLSLLGLGVSSGEEDELALVALQSGDVVLEGLLVHVTSSVVNADSDGSGKSGGHFSGLHLEESEATAVSYLGCILSGLTVDEGSELLEGAGESAGGSGLSFHGSLLLVGGLSEPCLDEFAPVLSEMDIRNDVVVLHFAD